MNNGLYPNHQAQSFTSAEQSVVVSATVTVLHGLPAVPRRLRWVLVCKVAEGGFAAGDECDVMSARGSSNGGIFATVGANATKAFIVVFSSGVWQVFNFSTQAAFGITTGNWRLKCYAEV